MHRTIVSICTGLLLLPGMLHAEDSFEVKMCKFFRKMDGIRMGIISNSAHQPGYRCFPGLKYRTFTGSVSSPARSSGVVPSGNSNGSSFSDFVG